MAAIDNYNLASNNANIFHQRVEALLVKALQDIDNDSVSDMSNEAIRKRRQYLNTVFQEQFREGQKVAKYLAKVWDDANINIDDQIPVNSNVSETDQEIIDIIKSHINTFASVSQLERLPSGGEELKDLAYELSNKNDIPGYVGTAISRRAVFKKFTVSYEEGIEANPGDLRKISLIFNVKHYMPDGTYINALNQEWSADVVDDPAHPIVEYRDEMTDVYQQVIIENVPIVSVMKKQVQAAVDAGYYDLKLTYA